MTNPYVKNHELNGKETPFTWEQPYYQFYKKDDNGKVWKEMTDMPVNEEKNLYPLSSFINLENEGLRRVGNTYTHDCGKDGKERNTGLCELLNDGDFDCKTIEVKDGKGKRRKVDISSRKKKISFVALGCLEKSTCRLNDVRADKLEKGMKMGGKEGKQLVLDVFDFKKSALKGAGKKADDLNMIELKVWCEKEGKETNMYYKVDHQMGTEHSLRTKLLPKLFKYRRGRPDQRIYNTPEKKKYYTQPDQRYLNTRRRRRLLQYGRSPC